MLHDLYILNTLLANDSIQEVQTVGHLAKGMPTHAVAIAKSTKGIALQLTASYQSNKNVRSIHLLTQRSYMVANLLTNELAITRSTEPFGSFSRSTTEIIQAPSFHQPLALELRAFLSCIKAQSTPFVTAADGIQALLLQPTLVSLFNQLIKTLKKRCPSCHLASEGHLFCNSLIRYCLIT